ncbi:hypothetical protein F4802DRAFT_571325 [Xylaria palmicola]|nr:hypothetical protein F4802DRAFT_571325 [Xylaria palmicola]
MSPYIRRYAARAYRWFCPHVLSLLASTHLRPTDPINDQILLISLCSSARSQPILIAPRVVALSPSPPTPAERVVRPLMAPLPEYDHVKITAPGRSHFVRSHSFSHHHRPRFGWTRCPEDCARVSLGEWNDLIERERGARSADESLARENRTLKSDLRTMYQETRRLDGRNRELQAEVNELRAHYHHYPHYHHPRDDGDDDDVAAARFRRRVAALRAEVDGKERALRDLRKEKELVDVRVRELTQTVTDQGAEISQLAEDVERLRRSRKKDRHELGVRAEAVREAWSLVDDLRRQLRRYRDSPFPPHRYDFV